MDESTDINDLSQLVIYVKTVNKDFSTSEDFYCVVPLHGNVNGETIWEVVNTHVFAQTGTSKLSAVCTDGARVLTGRNKGFVGFLNQNNISVPCFHCIIHQHVLLAKELNVTTVMKTSIKIINKIRGGHNALNHRKFKTYLEEIEADYGDLLLFTEVRWLSRGRSLARLFDLREEVVEFLKQNPSPENDALVGTFGNNDFYLDLGFLSDISNIINELNLLLQGKDKYIFDLVVTVKQFRNKLSILKRQIQNAMLISLPKTKLIYSLYPNPAKLNEFQSIIDNLLSNFDNRFCDFDKIYHLIDLHNNSLACDIEAQSLPIQEEVKKMNLDFLLPCATGREFWSQLNEEVYPQSKLEILKLYSIFASTYNCEAAFSVLKLLKSKHRNRISDLHLDQLMRIKCFDEKIDVNEILNLHLDSVEI